MIRFMLDPELLERITTRRAELDELQEQLAQQPAEARAERDELAGAGRVLERITGQRAEERASAGPVPGQAGGRAVTLIPHREPDVEEDSLPWDYQRIIAAVRQAAWPITAREVGRVQRAHGAALTTHDGTPVAVGGNAAPAKQGSTGYASAEKDLRYT
ncbi:hypothetical protein DN051_40505 [Streptomyces cadmiisoli]|uniref:Uncharacterized protein n=2 Tax=Streptomyces cadmiisoli TaxID=2184053 RepID=A0A2Z4IRT5_9ACTN|nr:hypothetical protein DN051_00305 [Streptomyces cadmiisoli]AWW42102.1 hypothetical protein DN051_40505 [Streptomyces cadmiisoli]